MLRQILLLTLMFNAFLSVANAAPIAKVFDGGVAVCEIPADLGRFAYRVDSVQVSSLSADRNRIDLSIHNLSCAMGANNQMQLVDSTASHKAMNAYGYPVELLQPKLALMKASGDVELLAEQPLNDQTINSVSFVVDASVERIFLLMTGATEFDSVVRFGEFVISNQSVSAK